MTIDTVIEKKKLTVRTLKEPGKYKVSVFNDNVTPVEFVVAMLMSVFGQEHQQAIQITMAIHNQGKGTAGIYSYEIAEQKTFEASDMAKINGYPLVLKVEAE